MLHVPAKSSKGSTRDKRINTYTNNVRVLANEFKGEEDLGVLLLLNPLRHLLLIQEVAVLIIGLCILLRLYQLNTGRTSVRNKVSSARFYCALLTLQVSALDIFFCVYEPPEDDR
jgi:hypothetical protein